VNGMLYMVSCDDGTIYGFILEMNIGISGPGEASFGLPSPDSCFGN
jgi:hypothetical protein